MSHRDRSRHGHSLIAKVTDEIEGLARADATCGRLMTVPGIGPIIASAMVAATGNGAAFAKGRDFAAWLGLVPKQMSTGDRTILGHITKRGNRYLRMLFIQGARSVLLHPTRWPSTALDRGSPLRRGAYIATF
jgi:transposase